MVTPVNRYRMQTATALAVLALAAYLSAVGLSAGVAGGARSPDRYGLPTARPREASGGAARLRPTETRMESWNGCRYPGPAKPHAVSIGRSIP